MYRVLNKLLEYIYFYISKKPLLHTLLLFVFKIVESLQCILKSFEAPKHAKTMTATATDK